MLIAPGFAQNAETGSADAFKQALEKDGFTVQQGELGVFDLIKVYELGLIPAVYGNNPSTRYIAYFVPPAPGYEVDKLGYAIAQAVGKSGNSTALIRWLRPDEAIVFVGRTPPECRYFSFDANLLFSEIRNETVWVWTSLGDPVNNLVIKTTGTLDGKIGDPFNQTTMVITTADRGIDQRIRAAAEAAGYDESIVNTQVLPSTMLNMGSANKSDTFAMYIRPAMFKNIQAGNDYLNNTPAKVFRITPNTTTKLDLFQAPELKARGTGTNEFDLTEDLEELRQAILTKYSGLNATELPTSIWLLEGYDGLQRLINTWGPNNDACYLWTASRPVDEITPPFCDLRMYYNFTREPGIVLGNDPDEFIIVYGVNHVATGKGSYQNFGLFGADIMNGVGAVTDANFNGTAQEYLPNNPNAKYLYVYKIARNSTDTHCFNVPFGIGAYGIDLNQKLLIIWRLYLEKASKVGPSYNEIIYDRAIKFDPKK